MNPRQLNLNAPWAVVKERMKENNINLTDQDLDYQPGREEELLERLQQKIKKPKQDIKILIESISSNTESAG